MSLPAFIDEFVKSAMNAGMASSPSRQNRRGGTAMAEAVVKRPDLVPQAATQKIQPGGMTDPSVSTAIKNTPPPAVYSS